MRSRVGARPDVDIAILVVTPPELERAGLRPRAHDEVVRLVEHFPRQRGVHLGRKILAPDPADEAGDDAPPRDDVEHGDLLRHPQGISPKRKTVSEDGDLRPGGPARQNPRDHVRRGHKAIGVLVVLVHADAVETQGVGIFELVEVAVVELGALGRVEKRVGKRDPRGIVLLVEIRRVVGPRHEVEKIRLHPHALLLQKKPPPQRLRLAAYTTSSARRPLAVNSDRRAGSHRGTRCL
jgi:hypothetical protein